MNAAVLEMARWPMTTRELWRAALDYLSHSHVYLFVLIDRLISLLAIVLFSAPLATQAIPSSAIAHVFPFTSIRSAARARVCMIIFGSHATKTVPPLYPQTYCSVFSASTPTGSRMLATIARLFCRGFHAWVTRHHWACQTCSSGCIVRGLAVLRGALVLLVWMRFVFYPLSAAIGWSGKLSSISVK